jgi:hypothetical protein
VQSIWWLVFEIGYVFSRDGGGMSGSAYTVHAGFMLCRLLHET